MLWFRIGKCTRFEFKSVFILGHRLWSNWLQLNHKCVSNLPWIYKLPSLWNQESFFLFYHVSKLNNANSIEKIKYQTHDFISLNQNRYKTSGDQDYFFLSPIPIQTRGSFGTQLSKQEPQTNAVVNDKRG